MARLRFENYMAKGVRHKFTWNSAESRSDYYVRTGSSGYALGHLKVSEVTGASLSISSAVSLAGIASGSAGAASGGGLFYDASGFVKRKA